MLAFVMILIAALAIALAYSLRARLRRLDFLSWIGWVLVGAGMPVLVGQMIAWSLLQNDEADFIQLVQFALSAGLAGGLGWMAACLSIRLSPGSKRDK